MRIYIIFFTMFLDKQHSHACQKKKGERKKDIQHSLGTNIIKLWPFVVQDVFLSAFTCSCLVEILL